MIRPQMPRRFRRSSTPQPFSVARGSEFVVPCALVPADQARTRTITPDGQPTRIALGVRDSDDGSMNSVYLTPKTARMLAAALLNLSDEVDGTTPLSFVPDAPSGDE